LEDRCLPTYNIVDGRIDDINIKTVNAKKVQLNKGGLIQY
jgi:hypothetical protein